jgi:hypothetical protein
MPKREVFASEVLSDRLRQAGYTVRTLWQAKNPASGTAWLEFNIITAPHLMADVLAVVMVQTFAGGDGWEAWIPAHPGIDIDLTVEAVIKHVRNER